MSKAAKGMHVLVFVGCSFDVDDTARSDKTLYYINTIKFQVGVEVHQKQKYIYVITHNTNIQITM